MTKVIESPNSAYSLDHFFDCKLFLAGGITNCRDWQSELITSLGEIPELTIYNPRRKNFNIGDSVVEHLNKCDMLVFCFMESSVCPITLYELGRWGNSGSKLMCIMIEPSYPRRIDVELQTMLSRDDVKIFSKLSEVEEWIRGVMIRYYFGDEPRLQHKRRGRQSNE